MVTTTKQDSLTMVEHIRAQERERCADLLEAKARRLYSGKRRVSQLDQHVIDVLSRARDEIRAMKD